MRGMERLQLYFPASSGRGATSRRHETYCTVLLSLRGELGLGIWRQEELVLGRIWDLADVRSRLIVDAVFRRLLVAWSRLVKLSSTLDSGDT